jgi:hypothetical protein
MHMGRPGQLLGLILFVWPVGMSGWALADHDRGADEALLRQAGVPATGPELLAFLRKLSPTEADRKHIAAMVQKLGSDQFDEREKAGQELLQWQLAAVDELRKGLDDSDVEVARRCRECLDQIQHGPGVQLPMAAVRVLARTRAPGAVAALLDYLPHTRDLALRDLVCDALVALTDPAAPDPLLRTALKDREPPRRGAAAFVLGRSKDAAQRTAVAPLLTDPQPEVRYRAIQAFLAARDPAGVAPLIELTLEPPGELAYRVEDLLQRLAGEQYPDLPRGDSAADRQKRRDTWKTWWQAQGPKINLARLDEGPAFLGITLVPEMHANKVWEFDRAGKVLWSIGNLSCPIDAQVLPGGRVLVAELQGNRVTERDPKGNILWQKEINAPIAVQRLANGHTFIGTNQRLLIVNTEGKETWSYQPENGFFIHSVQRLRNGHCAMISMTGTIREVDAEGKVVRSLPLTLAGSWSGIEGVAGNRYLVVNNAQSKVLEVDAAGKIVWEHMAAGACYATRLPTGTTLIVSNSSGLIEVDRQGKVVADKRLPTSVWRVHRR